MRNSQDDMEIIYVIVIWLPLGYNMYLYKHIKSITKGFC